MFYETGRCSGPVDKIIRRTALSKTTGYPPQQTTSIVDKKYQQRWLFFFIEARII